MEEDFICLIFTVLLHHSMQLTKYKWIIHKLGGW